MASLKDIAAELGVSYTLVSKVLSGNLGTTGVSEITRQAILNKAKDLQYRKNSVAVALKSGRKGAVGIFLHHLGTPGSEISDRLIRALSAALGDSGLRMFLRYFTTNEEFHTACDSQLQQDVDGLIVGGCHHPPLLSRLDEIDAKGLPVVSVFFDNPDSHPHSHIKHNVGVNSQRQGYLAADHLLELGCRRLAHFRSMDSRIRGFKQAHEERGLEATAELSLLAKDFSMETGQRLTRQLLDGGLPFDGIVCQSDSEAVGAINELVRHGIDVPGTVKVTGVDNSPLADACIVPVTSVTSGVRQVGLKAVEMLLKRLVGEEVAPVIIEPRLVVRQSSAAKVETAPPESA